MLFCGCVSARIVPSLGSFFYRISVEPYTHPVTRYRRISLTNRDILRESRGFSALIDTAEPISNFNDTTSADSDVCGYKIFIQSNWDAPYVIGKTSDVSFHNFYLCIDLLSRKYYSGNFRILLWTTHSRKRYLFLLPQTYNNIHNQTSSSKPNYHFSCVYSNLYVSSFDIFSFSYVLFLTVLYIPYVNL